MKKKAQKVSGSVNDRLNTNRHKSGQVTIASILIANRGEIVSRIIRTCHKMGLRSIAVYSDADREASYVGEADYGIHIGGSTPSESYLNIEKILDAAAKSDADAIHPGYGFLSENDEFARRCEEAGFLFIGPHPEAIESMGSKAKAKEIFRAHEIPVLPGYEGNDQSIDRLLDEAKTLGYPLMIKAALGGGGKGMRIVENPSQLEPSIKAAQREAEKAFGDDRLILERFIRSGRHIEFQILGDRHGSVIHLFERECTIQRRYQKIIEESPSPVIDDTKRHEMGQAAIRAARAIGYDNAGTVEFIYSKETDEYFFLEVNTRLQVEHGVTEGITGLDLVEYQIKMASGVKLDLKQEELQMRGYSIECRLYAEDAYNGFLPSPGFIHLLKFPKMPGLRIESSVRGSGIVSIYYDPMIAKLIVWGENRQEAHRKMRYAIQQTVCLGTPTNLAFLLDLLEQDEVRRGIYDIHYAEEFAIKNTNKQIPSWVENTFLTVACLYDWSERHSRRKLLRSLPSGWRNSKYKNQEIGFSLNGTERTVEYAWDGTEFHISIGDFKTRARIVGLDNGHLRVEVGSNQFTLEVIVENNFLWMHSPKIGSARIEKNYRFPFIQSDQAKKGYLSTMPSQVIHLLVHKGQNVKKGDPLIVLSSMKMENTIEATEDGQVEQIMVEEGQKVDAGVALIQLSQQ